jgi:hypothetical protein
MGSWITVTTGARQFMVRDAAVTMRCLAASSRWWATPTTIVSIADGSSATFTGALEFVEMHDLQSADAAQPVAAHFHAIGPAAVIEDFVPTFPTVWRCTARS